jgi:hypothetical protein
MAIQHLIEKASRSPAITAGGVMSHPEKTAIKHQRLLKTLGPGVGPLRKLIPNGYVPEPVKRASRALKLNTDIQIDWQVLAALLAIHLLTTGNAAGRRGATLNCLNCSLRSNNAKRKILGYLTSRYAG